MHNLPASVALCYPKAQCGSDIRVTTNEEQVEPTINCIYQSDAPGIRGPYELSKMSIVLSPKRSNLAVLNLNLLLKRFRKTQLCLG